MIALSIAVLSMITSAASPSRAPTATTGRVAAVAVAMPSAAWLPSMKMPHLSIPKLRVPRLPKRDADADALSQTARRLKALVADEESWYADHATYSKSAFTIARQKTRADSLFDSIDVQVIYAGKRGWTALASHPGAPGKSCVIFVGDRNTLPIIPRTRASASVATAEGKPVCDQ